jgi:dihydroorotase
MQLTFLAGNVVFPNGVRPARIGIDRSSGSIASVNPLSKRFPDGVLIFPGFIDAHVHAREYPRPSDTDSDALHRWESACRKETFATAAKAAINGGVTLFAAMPNDPEPPDNERTYAAKVGLASGLSCPAIVYAVVTGESEPWADVPYKVYLEARSSRTAFDNWTDLADALPRYRGCRVFFHAEDPDTLRAHGSGRAPRWKTRPPAAEFIAVEKILDFTARWHLRTHICHVSTEKAVRLIADYNRTASLKVTCEATPHHLFFNVADGAVVSPGGRSSLPDFYFECNPPLRSEADRRFLLDALREGAVTALASDHAPHTHEDKRNETPGMPHLDTLAGFVGWLLRDGGFTPERIAEVFASAPGRMFAADLDRPHGTIEPGAAASFSVLDLSGSILVQGKSMGERDLETRCAWSPFDGIRLPARAIRTVVRGRDCRFVS